MRNFKNSKISYILEKTVGLRSYKSLGKRRQGIFKEEKSLRFKMLKIIGLIANILLLKKYGLSKQKLTILE